MPPPSASLGMAVDTPNAAHRVRIEYPVILFSCECFMGRKKFKERLRRTFRTLPIKY